MLRGVVVTACNPSTKELKQKETNKVMPGQVAKERKMAPSFIKGCQPVP